MIRRLLGAVLLASAVGVTSAAAEGLNLGWNDCPGGGTFTRTQTFACDVNTGTQFAMIGSVVPPPGTTAVTGQEMVLDVLSASNPLPQWWAFKANGTCRQTALTSSFDFSSFSQCTDYWAGQATGNIANYFIAHDGNPSRARILLVAAVDPSLAGPLDAATEYYSFRLNISRAKTTGAGNCTGCSENVCVVLNGIKLTQGVGVGDFIVGTATTPGNNIINWQAGLDCSPVPVRNRTWGQMKSLYR